jgi:integrase
MPRPRSLPWSRLAAEALDLYAAPLRRPATRRKVEQVLAELAPICPTTRDLSPASIARWIADHPGRRPATVRSLLSALRAVCRYGEHRNYLTNPFGFRGIRDWLPDSGDHEPIRRHRSAGEIGLVLLEADSRAQDGRWEARRLRVAVYALAYTGARAREILGLRREDVDLDGRIAWIRPNPRRPLKTASSRRGIPIAGPLLAVLGDWLGRVDRRSDWVLPHTRLDGPWLSGTIASRALGEVRALGEAAGVPGLTLLCFRHSFATASEGWGLGELAVQRLLGHGRPETQLHYRHADPGQLRPAVELVRYGATDRA